MKERKIKFVIDLSWLHSRSKYAFRELTWEVDGVNYGTGTIHGVYEAITGVLNEYGKGVDIILAMDGTPKKQQGLSGGYKGGRTSDASLDVVQISRWDVARQFTVLPQVRLAYHKWMEADEVMGFIAKTKKDDEVVILFSGDGDLRQLIDSSSGVYCTYAFEKDKGYVLEDESHLLEHGIKDLAGLNPDGVALHLAICGDSSDGIHGIPRFLRAVSKEISNQCKTIDGLRAMVENVDTMIDGKVKKGLLKIKEEFKQVETNWLMTFIDPLYIPTYYNKHSFKEEVGLGFFDRYGCQKAYNDLASFLGVDVDNNTIESGDFGNVLGSESLPDNTMMGGATEFEFGG